MSKKRFLETLQALLTMVDPNDPCSVACVLTTLENLRALARRSDKCDAITERLIARAIVSLDELVSLRDHFAGKRGQYEENTAKRHRLEQMLMPGC